MSKKKQQPSSSIDITRVNALAELERFAIQATPIDGSEVKLLCPVHVDTTPSCHLNTHSNLWICRVCKAKGDIISLLALHQKVDRAAVLVDLSTRYPDLHTRRILSPELVEKYHSQIFSAGPLLGELYARGVTEQLIRKARLGYHNGRITIPIFDAVGNCLNIRHYLPGAPAGAEKMKNTPGYGGSYLYQIEQIDKYETIWILGGEMKALAAAGLLNAHGIGCISGSSGEGNWDPEHSKLLKGKRTYICFDIDPAGVVASRTVAAYIFNAAGVTRIIDLSTVLSKEKYPKGDVNDFIGREHGTAEQLMALMLSSEEYLPPQQQVEEQDKTVYDVLLSSSTNAKYVNKWIKVSAIVATLDPEPYLVPKEVGVKCDKAQPDCPFCPIMMRKQDANGYADATVPDCASGLLAMVNNPKKLLRTAIRESLSIPDCKSCQFQVKTHYKVLDVRLAPQLSIGVGAGEESSKNVMISAFVVADSVEMSTPYTFTGKVFPRPENQQAVLLLSQMELGIDSLTSFAPTKESLEGLKVFQPVEWTERGLVARLEEIYNDFEANVTRIYKRHEMHLAIDLVYHSILGMAFDGKYVKGWVDGLITGDTSNGKTEAAKGMMEYYRLGTRANCENTTRAGLLGGVSNSGKRYYITWGILPMHDRRVVLLEEIGSENMIPIIGQLTDMRSDGIAEIPMIEKGRALARTRLLFIGNPRSKRSVSSHAFGIEIIKDLMVRNEDVRRLDFAIIVANSQVKSEEIDVLREHRPICAPKYLAALCQALILWAWTRVPEQISFEPEAQRMILEEATKFANQYSDSVPLVDRGDMRHKLARLSASLAARTFSCSEDMRSLIVRQCHVEFICKFLRSIYDDPVFGYGAFSKAQAYADTVQDPAEVTKAILTTKYPKDFIQSILYAEQITSSDIQDWMEVDRDIAQRMISLLVRKHAVYREKREYVKTPDFIVLLKNLLKKPEQLVQRVEQKAERF